MCLKTKNLKISIAFIGLAIAAGCASNTKTPSEKELASARWNGARASVLLSLARDQYATGNFDKSRESLSEALKLDPKNSRIHVLSAQLAIEQGQLEIADGELKLARELDPKNAEADYLTGVIYQRWEQPDKAFDSYQHACEKAPNELAYIMAKAEMLVAVGKSEEALTLLVEKVAFFEHSAVIRDAVGLLLVQKGQIAEAADMFRRASILAPDEPTIREHLASALYQSGEFSDAADILARLVKDDPFARRSDLWLTLGESQMQTHRISDARDSFQTATDLNPAVSTPWLNLAKAALAMGDLRRADLSLRKAQSLGSDDEETTLLIGYLRLRQERLPEALAAFTKASAQQPSDTVSLCMIGYVMEKQSRPNDAMRYYAAALKIQPSDEMARKLMASLNVQ